MRFTVELGARASAGDRGVVAVREALLACGVSADQIELTGHDGFAVGLRVHHDLDTVP